MKSYTELEGEQGCRVPLSIGTPVEATNWVDKVPKPSAVLRQCSV